MRPLQLLPSRLPRSLGSYQRRPSSSIASHELVGFIYAHTEQEKEKRWARIICSPKCSMILAVGVKKTSMISNYYMVR